MDRTEAEGLVRSAGLGERGAQMARRLLPAAALERVPWEGEPPVGTSRFGGAPDLPPGFEWPHDTRTVRRGRLRREEVRSVPLDFMAQIRLPDLPPVVFPEEAPRTGWLYFFYDAEAQPWGFDPADRGGWAVAHHEGHPEELERKRMRTGVVARPCAIRPRLIWTLPESDDRPSPGPFPKDYFSNLERLETRLGSGGDPDHRVFGHAVSIQGEMSLQCEMVTRGNCLGGAHPDRAEERFGRAASDWLLLLQLDTDDELVSRQWMWGDCGRVYFWIRRQDLRDRRFDRVWTILQCT